MRVYIFRVGCEMFSTLIIIIIITINLYAAATGRFVI